MGLFYNQEVINGIQSLNELSIIPPESSFSLGTKPDSELLKQLRSRFIEYFKTAYMTANKVVVKPQDEHV